MPEKRRILDQVSFNIVTASLVVQLVPKHVVLQYRLRKFGQLF